jgi:glycosyltransferase involved in cell wall biosynthesis
MAKVSILMNGYNAQKYLKEAIDSIYAQTFEDWEIVFIDNCSTDNTKQIVDGYDNKIRYYKTKENIQLGAARNFGLQYCKGEYIAFLDTDDIWLETKLEKQIKIMEENKESHLCYGGVIYIDKNSDEIGRFLPVSDSENVFAQQLKRYEINMQSVVLRNNDNIKFNEKLKHSPDFDLFMKIISKYEVSIIKEYIVKYRKLENSLTSKNIAVWWSEMKYTLDNIFQDLSLKEKYRKEYEYAYAKVAYNKARYLISIDKKDEASHELAKYKFVDIKYFILYIVSLFPSYAWNIINKYKSYLYIIG